MQKRYGLLAALFLCLSFGALAQTGIIKGFVYDRSTGEPMIFTNVVLAETKFAGQTDVNGYFSITQVPAGTYTIFTTVMGYDTSRTTITVKPGDIISKKIFLSRRERQLKGVEVSARKIEKSTQINAGTTTVTAREIKLMPSAGGEPDIAQYLQVVPGVVFTGDQGGQLYIRGGAPAQTGILLDGVTIYNPFHQIGLFSVFETDAIRNVDVQSAGFNAQYGNRTSAILDVRTKDGNKNRLGGKVSVSPLMARVMLEGPIARPKKEGGAGSSFLVSAKHSYFDQTSKTLYGGFGEPFKSSLPYSFTDLYGKVTLHGENGSKLNLFGFNFDDKAKAIKPEDLTEAASAHWTARGAGATFVVTPANSSALINGHFAVSKYNLKYTEADYVPSATDTGVDGTRESGISGFEGGIDFTYYMPRYSQLKYGIEVSGQYTTLDYYNELGNTVALQRRNTSAALFIMYRKNFGDKFIFEPGFRAQYYSGLSVISPEPRLGLKYNLSKTVRLKAAGGLYSQNIISTKSDRDIVNFFTGFLLSPDEAVRNTDMKDVDVNLQTAYHALGGIEVDVRAVEFNLEPWYKKFNQNIELSRIKITNGNFTAGEGEAKGVDLSARYSKNRIYLWGVVSYQEIIYKTLVLKDNIVRYENGALVYEPVAQTYAPPFDRRVNVNLLGAYTAGKNKDWEFSARFNLGSPFPFTQTQGFYENVPMMGPGGHLDNNPATTNGQIGILYNEQLNGGRLSWYHRLDISVKKKFTLSKNSNIETTLGVTNVYDRDNIFYVSRLSGTRVYQLPVFPSLNVTWNF